MGLPRLASWANVAVEVAQTSIKLSGLFLKNTGPLMTGKASALTPSVSAAWAKAGLSLHSQHGWQGELLAQSFFNHTGNILPALSPTAFQLLAGSASSLFPKIRERDFFRHFPATIRGWPPEDQANLMRITIALAPIDPHAAFDVYRALPTSLADLNTTIKSVLLRLLAKSGAKLGVSVRDFVPVAGPLLASNTGC